jgi:hypothetical protein
MSNQETIKDLIFMLPYALMFFTYLLVMLVGTSILITISFVTNYYKKN